MSVLMHLHKGTLLGKLLGLGLHDQQNIKTHYLKLLIIVLFQCLYRLLLIYFLIELIKRFLV